MKIKTLSIIGIIVTFFTLFTLISCNSKKEIQYTNTYGDTYIETAVTTQVMITFVDGISESTCRQIIKDCGGKVLEYYPLLDSYLVETEDDMEMDFILKARKYYEVEEAYLNTISDPMSVDMHIMDIFNSKYVHDNKNNVHLSHGDYCYYAATTAYPEYPEHINIKRYEHNGTESAQKKYLHDIFEQSEKKSLILINISLGPKLGKKRQLWEESNNRVRNNWMNRYLDRIVSLANDLLKLSKHNPNFIVFKAAGNDGCHVMDEVIFNKLEYMLKPQQIEILKSHVFFVCAKDNDFDGIEKYPIDKTKLYAYYSNSPAQYCPFMTMVDISHLYVPGTSFAAPYMLGKTARLFDMTGYKPQNAINNSGFTVEDMVNHIKNTTKKYAENVQQPGLYDETYYYNNRYSFTGILKCDYEDLCETGYLEHFYYIEIDPINIQVEGESYIEEPLSNVTRLQISCNPQNQSLLGNKITVTGELLFHIGGCHIHTDAYLVDVAIDGF